VPASELEYRAFDVTVADQVEEHGVSVFRHGARGIGVAELLFCLRVAGAFGQDGLPEVLCFGMLTVFCDQRCQIPACQVPVYRLNPV
jgi:hypothetical protein